MKEISLMRINESWELSKVTKLELKHHYYVKYHKIFSIINIMYNTFWILCFNFFFFLILYVQRDQLIVRVRLYWLWYAVKLYDAVSLVHVITSKPYDRTRCFEKGLFQQRDVRYIPRSGNGVKKIVAPKTAKKKERKITLSQSCGTSCKLISTDDCDVKRSRAMNLMFWNIFL